MEWMGDACLTMDASEKMPPPSLGMWLLGHGVRKASVLLTQTGLRFVRGQGVVGRQVGHSVHSSWQELPWVAAGCCILNGRLLEFRKSVPVDGLSSCVSLGVHGTMVRGLHAARCRFAYAMDAASGVWWLTPTHGLFRKLFQCSPDRSVLPGQLRSSMLCMDALLRTVFLAVCRFSIRSRSLMQGVVWRLMRSRLSIALWTALRTVERSPVRRAFCSLIHKFVTVHLLYASYLVYLRAALITPAQLRRGFMINTVRIVCRWLYQRLRCGNPACRGHHTSASRRQLASAPVLDAVVKLVHQSTRVHSVPNHSPNTRPLSLSSLPQLPAMPSSKGGGTAVTDPERPFIL